MNRRLPTIALTAAAGLLLGWLLMLWMGLGDAGASVGGVSLGYQQQPRAGEAWEPALRNAAAERELTDWHISADPAPRLEGSTATRWCAYEARLVGSYTVDCKLVAPEGGKWSVAEWRLVE